MAILAAGHPRGQREDIHDDDDDTYVALQREREHSQQAREGHGHFRDDGTQNLNPPHYLALHREDLATRDFPPQCRSAVLARIQGRRNRNVWQVPPCCQDCSLQCLTEVRN